MSLYVSSKIYYTQPSSPTWRSRASSFTAMVLTVYTCTILTCSNVVSKAKIKDFGRPKITKGVDMVGQWHNFWEIILCITITGIFNLSGCSFRGSNSRSTVKTFRQVICSPSYRTMIPWTV